MIQQRSMHDELSLFVTVLKDGNSVKRRRFETERLNLTEPLNESVDAIIERTKRSQRSDYARTVISESELRSWQESLFESLVAVHRTAIKYSADEDSDVIPSLYTYLEDICMKSLEDESDTHQEMRGMMVTHLNNFPVDQFLIHLLKYMLPVSKKTTLSLDEELQFDKKLQILCFVLLNISTGKLTNKRVSVDKYKLVVLKLIGKRLNSRSLHNNSVSIYLRSMCELRELSDETTVSEIVSILESLVFVGVNERKNQQTWTMIFLLKLLKSSKSQLTYLSPICKLMDQILKEQDDISSLCLEILTEIFLSLVHGCKKSKESLNSAIIFLYPVYARILNSSKQLPFYLLIVVEYFDALSVCETVVPDLAHYHVADITSMAQEFFNYFQQQQHLPLEATQSHQISIRLANILLFLFEYHSSGMLQSQELSDQFFSYATMTVHYIRNNASGFRSLIDCVAIQVNELSKKETLYTQSCIVPHVKFLIEYLNSINSEVEVAYLKLILSTLEYRKFMRDPLFKAPILRLSSYLRPLLTAFSIPDGLISYFSLTEDSNSSQLETIAKLLTEQGVDRKSEEIQDMVNRTSLISFSHRAENYLQLLNQYLSAAQILQSSGDFVLPVQIMKRCIEVYERIPLNENEKSDALRNIYLKLSSVYDSINMGHNSLAKLSKYYCLTVIQGNNSDTYIHRASYGDSLRTMMHAIQEQHPASNVVLDYKDLATIYQNNKQTRIYLCPAIPSILSQEKQEFLIYLPWPSSISDDIGDRYVKRKLVTSSIVPPITPYSRVESIETAEELSECQCLTEVFRIHIVSLNDLQNTGDKLISTSTFNSIDKKSFEWKIFSLLGSSLSDILDENTGHSIEQGQHLLSSYEAIHTEASKKKKAEIRANWVKQLGKAVSDNTQPPPEPEYNDVTLDQNYINLQDALKELLQTLTKVSTLYKTLFDKILPSANDTQLTPQLTLQRLSLLLSKYNISL